MLRQLSAVVGTWPMPVGTQGLGDAVGLDLVFRPLTLWCFFLYQKPSFVVLGNKCILQHGDLEFLLTFFCSLDPDHILHGQFLESQDVSRERLKSRRSFVPAARKLLDSLSEMDVRAAQWTNTK